MPKTSAMPAPQSGDLSGTFEEAILYDTAAYFDVSPPWLQGLAMSLSPGEQLELVIHVLQSIQITRFTLLSGACIIFYDYAISLTQEIELIWGKHWSIIKCVFLWHRYFGIFCAVFEVAVFFSDTLSDSRCADSECIDWNSCYFWLRWETWGYSAVVLTTEVVLLLWIFVIYNKNLWILAFAACLLLGEVATVMMLLIKSVDFQAKAHLIPGITFCLSVHEPVFFHMFWTPILAYHSIIFGLYLFKGCLVCAHGGRQNFQGGGLLERIYRDSLVNFLSIFAAYLACAVMWLVADPFLAQVPVGFALSLSITSCTRLLLNIRHAYYTHAHETSSRVMVILPDGSRSQSQISTSDLAMNEEQSLRPVRTRSIYAENASRDLWAFELREMKWSGKLDR